ncbi:hypothetical protein KFE25_001018, partial [Diacronema lutheri]
THGGEWLFFTNCGAPRYHIVAVDIEAAISRARETAPGPPAYRVVVAESEHTLGGGDYAKGGHRVGDKLLLKYMNHEDSEVYFRFESFLTPPVIYRYSPQTREPPEPVLATKIAGLDTSEFMIEQLFATSKDGTRVPLFVVRAKELLFDGESGAALFANTFDDFAACAELLAERKYTSARKLAIHGASNGGLLVAAAANQRPELFGCVLCQVGLLDMLRFHRFTIGHFWCAEYGSPDDADAFGHIRAYSPYHNMAAQLQHVFGSDVRHLNPILVRVETKAGHGSGTATSKRLEAAADMYTFVLRSLGIKLDER